MDVTLQQTTAWIKESRRRDEAKDGTTNSGLDTFTASDYDKTTIVDALKTNSAFLGPPPIFHRTDMSLQLMADSDLRHV